MKNSYKPGNSINYKWYLKNFYWGLRAENKFTIYNISFLIKIFLLHSYFYFEVKNF